MSTTQQQAPTSVRKDNINPKMKQLAHQTRVAWLKQVLAKYYEFITTAEVEQMLQNGQDEISRYATIPDVLVHFFTGAFPDWSLPLYLTDKTDFDLQYFTPPSDFKMNSTFNIHQTGKVLNLDVEEFLDDFIDQTFEEELANVLEVWVATRAVTVAKVERAIFVTERQGDANVMIYGMYVEEHTEFADRSERYRVYIQYIAKTGLQKRKFYPTIAQVILIGYMRFAELLGYEHAHLWVDPPDADVEYIFRGTNDNGVKVLPKENAFPVLRKWYVELFKEHGFEFSPYTWDSTITLPPTFGQGDFDIKSRSDKSVNILSSLRQVVERIESAKKELNNLFKVVTLVVKLETPLIVYKPDMSIGVARDNSLYSEWPQYLEAHEIVSLPFISFSKTDYAKCIESSNYIVKLIYKNQRKSFFKSISPAKSFPMPNIASHTAVAYTRANNTKSILVFGGSVDFEILSHDMYELSCDTWNWSKVKYVDLVSAQQPTTATQPEKTSIFDDDDDTEDHDELHEKGIIPCGRSGHTCVLYDKSLYIYGGINEDETSMDDLWEYKIEQQKWERIKIQSIAPIRCFHSAVVHASNMFIFGGTSIIDNSKLRGSGDMFQFNFATKVFSRVNPIQAVQPLPQTPTSPFIDDEEDNAPPDRYGHSAVVWNDKMYIFGGAIGDHMVFYDDMYEFDFLKLQWSQVFGTGNVPEGRKFHAATVTDTAMYVFGGEGIGGFLNSLHEFNFKTNGWVKVDIEGDMFAGLTSFGFCHIANEMIVVGGWMKRLQKLPKDNEETEVYIKSNQISSIKLPITIRKQKKAEQ